MFTCPPSVSLSAMAGVLYVAYALAQLKSNVCRSQEPIGPINRGLDAVGGLARRDVAGLLDALGAGFEFGDQPGFTWLPPYGSRSGE
jgi:hypothetical protein